VHGLNYIEQLNCVQLIFRRRVERREFQLKNATIAGGQPQAGRAKSIGLSDSRIGYLGRMTG
jgi:hypothetical protein